MLLWHEIRHRLPHWVSDRALRQPQMTTEQANGIVPGETLGVADDIAGKFWAVNDVVENQLSVGFGGGEARIGRLLNVEQNGADTSDRHPVVFDYVEG